MSDKYIFRLYALDDDERTDLLASLKNMLGSKLKDNYEIEVVNPLNDNNRATTDAVFVLPTFIRVSPPPSRGVIGDLSNEDKVLSILDIT